ncbi:MAG: hypothetical protein ACRCVX_12495 [Shewanella sp.]
MAKVVRILTSPLSIIDKKLGKAVSQIATFAISAVNPILGSLYGAATSYAFRGVGGKNASTSNADRNRLNATLDPSAPRTIVYGRTAMATDIRDEEYSGSKQEFLHRFIVCASHKVQSIESIYFDDKLAWTSSGGSQGEYAGYLTVTPILEGSAANAINISPRMGASRRYTGLAYLHFRYKLTGNSKKSESPFSQSIPTRITIIGNGMRCYDPRLDSSVGGNGSQRADNQATWVWDDNGARNPALQLLNYLLGYRINGKLAVGKGIPADRIDMQSFIVAANICDEPVSLAAGGFEPRYRTDGVFSEFDDMDLVLNQFKQSMNAVVDDADGSIRLTILHNNLAFPVATFGLDDIIGDVSWNPVTPLEDIPTVVRGTYTDPSSNSLYQSVSYPEVVGQSVDGIERPLLLDFPLVQSASQPQRLAKLQLKRAQYGATFSATFQFTAWRVQKNDVIRLNFAPLGYVNKLFRVVETAVNIDGTVPMVLREENAGIYAWLNDDQPAIPAIASVPFDPANNPIVQGIAQSFVEIMPPSNQTVFADWTGAPLPGQFPPRILKPLVTSAGIDIRTLDDVSYSISTAGVTATINNTLDSDEKGWITVTDASSGYVDLTIVISSISYGPFRIVFNKINGPSPTGTGPSGTRTTFTTITSSSVFIPIFNPSTPITVTVAAGKTVNLTAPLGYNISASTTTSAALTAKWQRSPAGVNTWTDVSPTVTGSAAFWSNVDFSGEPGEGQFNASDSPAAGTYDYRLVAQRTGGSGTISLDIFNGIASVIVN